MDYVTYTQFGQFLIILPHSAVDNLQGHVQSVQQAHILCGNAFRHFTHENGQLIIAVQQFVNTFLRESPHEVISHVHVRRQLLIVLEQLLIMLAIACCNEDLHLLQHPHIMVPINIP